MEQKNKLEFLKKSNLKNLIEENLNLNQIIKELDPERKLKLNYHSLTKCINEAFNKSWDKNTKQWIDSTSNRTKNNRRKTNIADGQMTMLGIIPEEDKEVSEPPNLVASEKNNINNPGDIQSTTKENESYQDSSREKISIHNATYEEIICLIKTFEGRITALENLYSVLKNHVKSVDRKNKIDKNDVSLIEIDEVIKLYTSSKNKKSININSELKDKVVEFIYEKYKFKDNESLAINIALLLALYKK